MFIVRLPISARLAVCYEAHFPCRFRASVCPLRYTPFETPPFAVPLSMSIWIVADGNKTDASTVVNEHPGSANSMLKMSRNAMLSSHVI